MSVWELRVEYLKIFRHPHRYGNTIFRLIKLRVTSNIYIYKFFNILHIITQLLMSRCL